MVPSRRAAGDTWCQHAAGEAFVLSGEALLKGHEPVIEVTQYIIVRRDLPRGTMCAQVAHAAGESFVLSYPRSSVKERPASEQDDREVGGSSPSAGANPLFITIVVVLGVRDEARLLRLERRLIRGGVPHVAIREPDEPYNGALTAIGIPPGPREPVAKYLHKLNPIPNGDDNGQSDDQRGDGVAEDAEGAA